MFADTHNMVLFLSIPTKSDGFEQIEGFLNANPIKYALTVNPTIYVSCIKQLWSTAMAKTINEEVQIHARVDGKKVVVPGAKKPWGIPLFKLEYSHSISLIWRIEFFWIRRIDLVSFVVFGEVQALICRIFLDGYSVLDVRIKEEAGIQLQAEEYDLMASATDLDEIKEVNANCILMANLQQASSSGTQTDSAPVYDSDGSAEVHEYENCYNNKIFNMFTQEEQYTELLEPIPESHQLPQNDNEVISEVTGVEQ
nr:hypothetical protein [Tanacetum cinerariifolium]